MKQEVATGQTDYTVLIFIPDSASTDGSGKTGLVAANLTVSGVRVETDNDVTVTDYTSTLNNLAALTTVHTDWGLLEVSSTLAPGLYRLDIADAIFASGAWSAVVYVMVTTSAAVATPMEFILVPVAPVTGVNLAQILGTAVATPATAGILDVNVKNIDNDAASAAGTVTFPGTVASTTNIISGTITTVGAVTGLTAANLDATVSSRATPAQVNTEVVDALNVDTYAEPTQGPADATITLAAKINYLYKAWRNKKTQTSTTFTLFADDTTTADQKATVSDDGTTATIGEIAAGP